VRAQGSYFGIFFIDLSVDIESSRCPRFKVKTFKSSGNSRTSEEIDGILPRIASFENRYIVGGTPITPRAGWGLIFWAMRLLIPKSLYQELSNEGSNLFLSSLELVF